MAHSASGSDDFTNSTTSWQFSNQSKSADSFDNSVEYSKSFDTNMNTNNTNDTNNSNSSSFATTTEQINIHLESNETIVENNLQQEDNESAQNMQKQMSEQEKKQLEDDEITEIPRQDDQEQQLRDKREKRQAAQREMFASFMKDFRTVANEGKEDEHEYNDTMGSDHSDDDEDDESATTSNAMLERMLDEFSNSAGGRKNSSSTANENEKKRQSAMQQLSQQRFTNKFGVVTVEDDEDEKNALQKSGNDHLNETDEYVSPEDESFLAWLRSKTIGMIVPSLSKVGRPVLKYSTKAISLGMTTFSIGSAASIFLVVPLMLSMQREAWIWQTERAASGQLGGPGAVPAGAAPPAVDAFGSPSGSGIPLS